MLEAKWILSGRSRHIDLSDRLIPRLRGRLGMRVDPAGYRFLYIERASPLGDCLREMAEKLFYNGDLPLTAADEE